MKSSVKENLRPQVLACACGELLIPSPNLSRWERNRIAPAVNFEPRILRPS